MQILRRLRRRAQSNLYSAFVGYLAVSMSACSFGSQSRDSSQHGDTTPFSGNPPTTASAEVESGEQTGVESPVDNSGAFLHSIPIPVPPGFEHLTPEIAIAYSSRFGVGAAGVGWDMPTPMISLNGIDGQRPASIAEDVERFDKDAAVERYSSNFGKIAILRDQDDWGVSTPTYVLSPFGDQTVKPIADEWGRPVLGSDKAAWQISLKSGMKYRYGYTDQASLFRHKVIRASARWRGYWTKSKTATAT